MATIHGVPPGRAGRVWLRHRRAVAERGSDLLETKLRILAAERERAALQAEGTAREWAVAAEEADRWLLRAALLGGRRGLRLAVDREPAAVHLTWATTMGVTYPDDTEVVAPEPDPDAATPDGAALVAARRAARQGLAAAAAHAAATAALEALDAEVRVTRRRLRALQERWLPRLDEATASLTEALEEQEREEGLRLRWAASRSGGWR
jgi:V/A-type H+-transporting ATPase subunit D